MKTLMIGLTLLFGATMVYAQDCCDEEVFVDDSAILTPEISTEDVVTQPAAPACEENAAQPEQGREAPQAESMKAPEQQNKEARQEQPSGEKGKDIVDRAIAEGHFKTLVKALVAAKLADTLKGQGPFTIFAPTDDAFAKLPQGTLDNLLKPENKSKLEDLLTHHVVSGQFTSAELMKMPKVKALDGKELNIRVKDGKVFVNEAEVIMPDLKARNGAIQEINAVLTSKE